MNIDFKPLSSEHFTKLEHWLNTPHVNLWYGENQNWTMKMISDKYDSYCHGFKQISNKNKPIHAFIIYFDDAPIGYIQYYNAYDFLRDGYQLNNLPNSLAAIDMFIGDENHLGKGIGTKSLELFLDSHVLTEFDYAFVDPDVSNLAAIKTYENAGFKPFDDQTTESVVLMVKPRNDFREIELLEKKLLGSASRKSINTLDELLADDFKEFGKSGLVYNKQDILSRLPNEEPREFNAKYFEVKSLGGLAYLINFRTLENGIEVLRSSIWKSIDGRLQMVFHQGTKALCEDLNSTTLSKNISIYRDNNRLFSDVFFSDCNQIAEHLCGKLKKFNESKIGKYQRKQFSIYIQCEKEIIAGLVGNILNDICAVNVMWVDQEYRNKKLGSTLLSQLITYAKKQDCKVIQLDTAEFQARNFYEKHGFVVIATLPQGFMGYDQYIMRRTV